MKKFILVMTLPIAVIMMACGGEEESNEESEETEEVDTTAADVIEESTELAFQGVEKGDYILYGHSDVDAADAVSSAAMMTDFEATGEWTGKVKVTINEVCQKAGCWITYIDDFDNEIRVYFRDHFTIPTETPAGTEVILYGSPYDDEISVEMQKHLMKDALAEGEELDQDAVAALQPKSATAFDCESILIKI